MLRVIEKPLQITPRLKLNRQPPIASLNCLSLGNGCSRRNWYKMRPAMRQVVNKKTLIWWWWAVERLRHQIMCAPGIYNGKRVAVAASACSRSQFAIRQRCLKCWFLFNNINHAAPCCGHALIQLSIRGVPLYYWSAEILLLSQKDYSGNWQWDIGIFIDDMAINFNEICTHKVFLYYLFTCI